MAADANATKGGEEVTKRFSQKSMNKSIDSELFMVLNEYLGSLLSCGNMNCDCFVVQTNQNIQDCVAKYLVQFERKNKYDQDSIILEWYKYAIAARTGHKHLWYCLPYNATWPVDINCLCPSQAHEL